MAAREAFAVLRAQAGDREALNELLGRVQESLYRYLVQIVGERGLAEDVLQEVFVLIHRKLRWLRDPDLFRPWAYRIASREALRRLARERQSRLPRADGAALEELAAPAAPEDPGHELLQGLPELLGRLSPSSRTVLALHFLHGMSIGEVAAVLGIPAGTAKSRLAYGLASLRRALSAGRSP